MTHLAIQAAGSKSGEWMGKSDERTIPILKRYEITIN